MIINYITCKDKKEAEKIAKILINKKLAACANIFPISSLYMWKGRLVNEKEHVLITKSVKRNAKKLMEEVKRTHSYEIPCILQLDVKANKEFERWINENSC